jgi:sugar phosphate isomerase/epimerase
MKNNQNPTRRDFLWAAGMGTAASLAIGDGRVSSQTAGASEPRVARTGRPLQLGLASYTLRKFDLDAALAMTRRVGLKQICLKSFHLPLDATTEAIDAAVTKVKQAGILLYGGGVISMKTEPQVDQAFRYAKAAGMSRIIAAPVPVMLPRIEDKVQQFDIEVCIHNHGPGDQYFPTPAVAYEKIQTLDKRIGLCHDIGHTLRYGEDPIVQTKECADRLLDIHLKDVTEASKKGHAVACGRGVIDLPAIVQTLIEIGYSGVAAFEYEADPEDPLPGLAESVGYINGLMDAT